MPVYSFSEEESFVKELTPFEPATNDKVLRLLYKKARERFHNKDIKAGVSTYLSIIRDYVGPEYEKHRRWSCYTLFRLLLLADLAENNRAYLADCPSDLVALLYGEVDREPMLLSVKWPKLPKLVWNQHSEGAVIIGFDITAAGLVENVNVIKTIRPGLYNWKTFAVELAEGWKFLPKIVDGKAVPATGRREIVRFEPD